MTLALALIGCSGMNPQSAHMVFERANEVGFDAYVAAYTDSDTATSRDSGSFVWTPGEDGFTFEGSIVGEGDWTGQVDLLGEASWTASSWSGSWSIEYIEVLADGVGLDGGLTWGLDLEGDHDSGSLEFSVEGEITATGDAEGTGPVDYTASVEITSNSFSFVAEGTVDGTPIDESFTLMVL